ncbi:MAG: Deferrochelatase/peroxidase EfeB [Alphaproteobacteria bacterium]|nr:Deferrochelatase/peroxidase EfeB [Alphaproteobacteria bacterium]
MASSPQVDTTGLQAIVLGNVAGCPLVRHIVLAVPEPEALRRFVASLYPFLRFGSNLPAEGEKAVINLSLAAPALKQVLPVDVYAKLETAFRDPPDAERLGDAGASAASSWWEGQFTGDEVGAFVHLFATDDSALEAATAQVVQAATDAGIPELHPRAGGGRLDARYLAPGPVGKGARLHFGYVDGLSNAKVAWDGAPSDVRPVDPRAVVLGYNCDSFPCAPARDPAAVLFRDSSYLAFRWIYQDVAAFERFLTEKGPPLFPAMAPAVAREMLAAKLMGRWRDGTPLALSPDAPAPERGDEAFTFASDPIGLACPVSAHIRVMNPKGERLSGMAATTGIPQVVRRGMPYGPELAGDRDDGVDRGVLGMFVCASIREQFMRLAAWATRNNFSDVFPAHGKDQDTLIGNRAVPGATRTFAIPSAGGTGRVDALPDFLRTKGTQYLMLMSRRAMQQVCGLD